MNIFKKLYYRSTRYQVYALRAQVELLTRMLKANLDIKYNLEDFAKYHDLHPDAKHIPVSEGERIHYIESLLRAGQKVQSNDLKGKQMFRGVEVKDNA